MSVTNYFSQSITTKTVLHCSGSKPNTAVYSKPHYNMYCGHVDREWNWKLAISHLHPILLISTRTHLTQAMIAQATVLDVCEQ